MWPCPHRLYHWCKITTSLRNFTTNNYWTKKRITWWALLTPTKEKINIICVLSTGDPFLSSTQWLTRCRVVSTFSIWWLIVRKTKQFAILGSVCGECWPLCTLKASLVDVENKGISLLQQNWVTTQVPDTEQYNFDLISEPRGKYSDLLPGYTWDNCI